MKLGRSRTMNLYADSTFSIFPDPNRKPRNLSIPGFWRRDLKRPPIRDRFRENGLETQRCVQANLCAGFARASSLHSTDRHVNVQTR